jgi:medium-chain acyl-[acyl-carrier-protein] hydrolase
MEPASSEVPAWTEELRIRSYDVDATRRATSLSLCRYFLEAAWNHAEALGFGFSHLQSQGKFWVLARWRFEVQQYPLWGEGAILRTWPRGLKSVFALRDFELQDETGRRLAAGSSAWLVIDAVSKRPQRLHKLFPNLAALHGKAALGCDPEELEDNEIWDNTYPLTVRYSDIDVNKHVNSSRYIGWIMDAYPAGFHLQHSLRVLDVNYLGETLEGEQLTVRTRQTDATVYSHSLIKPNGNEVCRARLEWKVNATVAVEVLPRASG